MYLKKTNLDFVLSLESLVLFLVLFGTFTNLYLTGGSNEHIHTFETFDQLKHATISCKDSSELETSSHDSKTPIDGTPSTESAITHCPIDSDRLNYFKDYELNSWLSFKHVQVGGHFKPVGCEPRQRVAIVIPYRDRQVHLEKFSLYIHQFLPDQLIDYTVFVIEQNDTLPFNRAKLFNVGVREITKLNPEICCFIFHDVDLLPLDQRNLYMCTTRPRHLSPRVSTLRFNLLYPQLFGGVVAMTKDHYDFIGGFSNRFFGWGGEDDDMFRRIIRSGLDIDRSPLDIGIYNMMKHRKVTPNTKRYQLLDESEHSKNGGNPETAMPDSSYRLNEIKQELLFTKITVSL